MLPPVLTSKRFVLRPYAASDIDRFIEIVMDEATQRFMGGLSADKQQERVSFSKIFDVYQSRNKRWFWIWGIYENGCLCGHMELKESVHTNGEELELVYMVHPAERKRGLMSEILDLFNARQQEWNRQLIATVSPDNKSSLALLQRWGVERTLQLRDEETGELYLKLYLKR
ncbi:GNAT family N-acetyltransferase [Niabella beijingensis]|uniref:GNAT family N-acetyltransferase n=1 Tax=Niabella beijingensis TaxID=2872700 RepID=UPI001CBB3A66|nr:GNAT family N-acetyltransferase [Niabella beijingensis]MBZ4192248.1 GNAT family N-acetyltransferase [Niabella beijingensis]